MANIYASAVITIAATWSDDSNGGCYSQARDSYKAQRLNESGLYARTLTMDLMNVIRFNREVDEWPLLTRGWVFQEKHLSPRMLHYTKDQLFWECGLCLLSQCGSHDMRFDLEEQVHPDQSLLKFNLHNDNISATWRELVEMYTRLQFTKKSDLLPALAGIAEREIIRRGHDAYLGGMWKDSILEDLGFYASGQEQTRIDSTAPSWSWAHYSGQVVFQRYQKARSLDLLEFTFTRIGRPNLGLGIEAHIRLRGPISSAVIWHANHVDQEHKLPFSVFPTQRDGAVGSIAFNTRGYVDFSGLALGAPLVVLILSQFNGTMGVGLALRESTGVRYQRVGLIDLRRDYHEFRTGTGMDEEKFSVFVNKFIAELPVKEVEIT